MGWTVHGDPAEGRSRGGGYSFDYELRTPIHTIVGTGATIGERHRPDGTRTSALRFSTRDRLSPLGNGRGYWRYIPTPTGVRFITGYQYKAGWGRSLDAVAVRPLVGWLTAWSFDRLRIWAENDVAPEAFPLWSVIRIGDARRPRASRCVRRPAVGTAMDGQPDTLRTLANP